MSELVTNSVTHARMGPTDAIALEVELVEDRLRLAVTDDGAASTPHRVQSDPTRPGGMGLLLVERLSTAWGVDRQRSGVTRVWCELVVAAS